MPYELDDIWHISPDRTRTIRDEYGYELFWAAETVLGQEQTRLMSHRRRNGCSDVHRGSFGGLLDYLFVALDIRHNEPRIAKEGLVLMAQPTNRAEQARAYQRKKARAQVEEMKTKHSNEGIDVSMPGRRKSSSSTGGASAWMKTGSPTIYFQSAPHINPQKSIEG